jgi:hypothetical protein
MGRSGEVAEGIDLAYSLYIKEEIGTLRRNALYARRAIDSFYKVYSYN